MNTYFLHYFSEIPVSISSRFDQQKYPAKMWNFLFYDLNTEIFLLDSLKIINDLKLHIGLDFFVKIDDLEETVALQKAKNLVEVILNIISFETLSFCKPAQLKSFINATNKDLCPSRFYVYPFDTPFPLCSLSRIDKNRLDLLWKAYNSSRNKDRIMRSLSWLRKGMNSDNVVDEFVSYWIALEILQCVLRKKFKWDKIKDIFIQKEINASCTFEKIYNARKELFHGYHELSDSFINKIKSYLETLRRAVIYANLASLKIDKNSFDYSIFINRMPRRIQIKPYSIFKGVLKNIPADVQALIESYPKVDFTLEGIDVSLAENEKLNVSWKTNNKFNLPKNCSFDFSVHELWGDHQAVIERADMDISSKKK